MPNLLRPKMPLDVEAAVSLIGNRARADILHNLSALGPSTVGRLHSALDISRPSLNRHLDVLSRAGLVQTDPPAGLRHGKNVVYAIHRTRVRELVQAYAAFIEGA